MYTRSLGTRSFVTKRGLLILFSAMLLLAFVASEQALADSRGNHQRGDVARYILPPGNYGGDAVHRRTRRISSRSTAG